MSTTIHTDGARNPTVFSRWEGAPNPSFLNFQIFEALLCGETYIENKLLPTDEQAPLLLQSLKEANTCCNAIAEVAWQKKIFNQFKIHKEVYHPFKATFKLSSQVLVRCISKVADAYKGDRKTKRKFKPLGSIAYDSRILSYSGNTASIWSVGGRLKIPFVCHNPAYLPYIKGESDLVFNKGKSFLLQAVDIPDGDIEDVESFIGVDFGLTHIAVTSDGTKHTGDALNTYREHRQKVRSSVQRKGTRNSNKLPKRPCGRQRTTTSIIHHTMATSIVRSAREQGKGIAIEELTALRFTSKGNGKKFRTRLGKWSFKQLCSFLQYKALMSGVRLVKVQPAYTSKTCSCCHHMGKRTNKIFECINPACVVDTIDADLNASYNTATLGATVNKPEKSVMYSCSVHCQI